MSLIVGALVLNPVCALPGGVAPAAAGDLPKSGMYGQRVVFHPQGKWIASAGSAVYVFDIATGKKVVTLTGHAKAPNPFSPQQEQSCWIRQAAFSPDGKALASAGYDNVVILWDWKAGKELRRLEGHGPRFGRSA